MKAEVKVLQLLKEQYKKVTGKDWKPAQTSQAKEIAKPSKQAMPVPTDSKQAQELKAQIDAQGTKVRELKTGGGSKVELVKRILNNIMSITLGHISIGTFSFLPGHIDTFGFDIIKRP